VKTVLRIAIGFAAFAGGLTFLVYGIAQAIDNGSCGSSSSGYSSGPPCPSGFGPMIALMVLGTFVGLIGMGIAAGGARGVGRFITALAVGVVAGVVFGIIDLHADDTRPGLEIVVAVVAPLLIFTLPGMSRRPVGAPSLASASGKAPPVTFATPPPKAATTNASAEDIATRLRQLDQLRDSGLLDEAAYKERRAQILAEL
jgi:hypothetical protein